ncbi:hypothetical protein [Ralstonia pseudosolanacearum]|uniref:hypothetical protein n=1 Tax=Ralstonia pseudosolanacearum TaxID=1310165 RepID=UPI0013C36016|nr:MULTISPECIES: hypothetical protein [Ralstonia]QWQ13357.1 hypothetical protein KN198_07965 [Ralstonia solanacearum]UZF26535.1 hypothetical protein LGV80_08485 [Ralstonia sp. RS642]BEU51447.1 hypothetical protein MAFF211520_17390 [Ralstonia pseudosolanacearum]BEU56688.1 hypothetical protein MAFF211521_17410 [Ralstonia pseudosolanacearum]BEU62624.1 hypothetical protein MAFF301524_24240 [Ralstonia pseudosolanacearum]
MSGKKLAAAQKELAFAKKAVDGLRTATAPDEEEYHWKEFIGRLTRFWNKTESALKGDPKFYKSPHVERVKGALKSDELIRYLSQARHADEHRHEEITGVMPGGVENVSSSGQVRVRNPKITINGVTMDVPPPPGFSRRVVRAELRLRAVRNRQQTYEIPRTHDGQHIGDASPVALAALGLAFYESVLDGLARDGWDSLES